MAQQRRVISEALNRLSGVDPVLDRLIDRHGPVKLPLAVPISSRFDALAHSIVSQQLNGAAAATIWGRILEAAGAERLTPEGVVRLGVPVLQASGASRAKARALTELAERVHHGELDLATLGRASDHEVISRLSASWGIGVWTAQMFLIFALARLDVWPTGDLGVRRGYESAWSVDTPLSPDELEVLGARFAPYRSIVAWLCWRVVDQVEGA